MVFVFTKSANFPEYINDRVCIVIKLSIRFVAWLLFHERHNLLVNKE